MSKLKRFWDFFFIQLLGYVKTSYVSFSGADDDDTILKAFDSFEINGKIDAEMYVQLFKIILLINYLTMTFLTLIIYDFMRVKKTVKDSYNCFCCCRI